jgi:hypothetical protein
MDESQVSGKEARAVMNGQCFGIQDNGRVPFTVSELTLAREEGRPLFYVPEGSLISFPEILRPAFVDSDVAHESNTEWVRTPVSSRYVLASPGLWKGTQDLPLWTQENCIESYEILSPYEIVCMSALYRESRECSLFTGKARTTHRFNSSPTHLHTHPLTAILSYDTRGMVRIGKGYTSQVADDLGVFVGIRRHVL